MNWAVGRGCVFLWWFFCHSSHPHISPPPGLCLRPVYEPVCYFGCCGLVILNEHSWGGVLLQSPRLFPTPSDFRMPLRRQRARDPGAAGGPVPSRPSEGPLPKPLPAPPATTPPHRNRTVTAPSADLVFVTPMIYAQDAIRAPSPSVLLLSSPDLPAVAGGRRPVRAKRRVLSVPGASLPLSNRDVQWAYGVYLWLPMSAGSRVNCRKVRAPIKINVVGINF